MNPLLTQKPVSPNKIDVHRALKAWPIFGGEEPETKPETKTEGGSAGGSSTPTLEELQKDPAKLTQLLTQTTQLSNQVGQLTAQLTETTTKLTAKEQAEQAAADAQLGEVERRDKELLKKDQQIQKLNEILNQKLIENAIANHPEYQWQSIRQVMGELDQAALKVNVDIEKGIAEIDGIDTQLKAIADRCSWLLKAPENQQQETQEQTPPRPGGRAPNPPSQRQSKEELKARAMKTYPSLQLSTGRPY